MHELESMAILGKRHRAAENSEARPACSIWMPLTRRTPIHRWISSKTRMNELDAAVFKSLRPCVSEKERHADANAGWGEYATEGQKKTPPHYLGRKISRTKGYLLHMSFCLMSKIFSLDPVTHRKIIGMVSSPRGVGLITSSGTRLENRPDKLNKSEL